MSASAYRPVLFSLIAGPQSLDGLDSFFKTYDNIMYSDINLSFS